MSDLIGAKELRARLKALRGVAKPILRTWGDETVELARKNLAPHNRTGATSRSLKVRSTNRRTVVTAAWGARFVEKDTKAHVIGGPPKQFKVVTFKSRSGADKVVRFNGRSGPSKVLKFNGRTRPVFAKKVTHPRRTGTPFLAPAARDALNKGELADEIVAAWNDAA